MKGNEKKGDIIVRRVSSVLIICAFFYYPLQELLIAILEILYRVPYVSELSQLAKKALEISYMRDFVINIIFGCGEFLLCLVLAYGIYIMGDHSGKGRLKKAATYLLALLVCGMAEFLLIRIVFIVGQIARLYFWGFCEMIKKIL